jgi:hypothetical protein
MRSQTYDSYILFQDSNEHHEWKLMNVVLKAKYLRTTCTEGSENITGNNEYEIKDERNQHCLIKLRIYI